MFEFLDTDLHGLRPTEMLAPPVPTDCRMLWIFPPAQFWRTQFQLETGHRPNPRARVSARCSHTKGNVMSRIVLLPIETLRNMAPEELDALLRAGVTVEKQAKD